MEKVELIKDIRNIIENTFEILRGGQCTNNASRLVFPDYSSGQKRVSEQELRFAFVEQLQSFLKKYKYYYSVETPTTDSYTFSQNRKNVPCKSGEGQSANFDLTIKDEKGINIAIIEFKANSVSQHQYAKDLIKLWNEKEKGQYRFFVCLFNSMEEKTRNALRDKLLYTKCYDSKLESSIDIHVIAQSLQAQQKKAYYDEIIYVENNVIKER